jgi:lipoprotein signal peptidase
MNRGTSTVAVPSFQVGRKIRLGQRSMVLALLTVVVVLDQASKWWAWRHVSGTIINDGGDVFVGAMVGRWYANPVTGALLDLLDVALLTAAVSVLVRRRAPAKLYIPGALMIGGWSSNLLDRVGMHYWTAPGSVRGAVDFIHLVGIKCNLADLFIVSATPVFLLATGYAGRRAGTGPVVSGSLSATPTTIRRPRPRTRMSAFAGAVGLVVAVGIGAANYGGVSAPLTSAGASAQH